MRAAGGVRKPLLELAGRTLLEHTLAAFEASATVTSIVVVAHADDLAAIEALAARASTKVVAVIRGGAERTDSVRGGCRAEVANEPEFRILCVHDGARPLVAPDGIDRTVRAAARDGAALLAVPVRDTLKRAADGERATETVERAGLWAAQTPQAFRREEFLELLERTRATASGSPSALAAA